MKQIRKITLSLFLAVATLHGKDHHTDHPWVTGRVLDATGAQTILQSSATSFSSTSISATATTSASVSGNQIAANGMPTTNAAGQTTTATSTVFHHEIDQNTQTWIQGSNYLYLVDDQALKPTVQPQGLLTRAIANRRCRMIIGDDVHYAQEKSKLFVLDPDGKECKLDILRQQRIQLVPSIQAPSQK